MQVCAEVALNQARPYPPVARMALFAWKRWSVPSSMHSAMTPMHASFSSIIKSKFSLSFNDFPLEAPGSPPPSFSARAPCVFFKRKGEGSGFSAPLPWPSRSFAAVAFEHGPRHQLLECQKKQKCPPRSPRSVCAEATQLGSCTARRLVGARVPTKGSWEMVPACIPPDCCETHSRWTVDRCALH